MTGFLEIRTLYEAYLEKAMDVELKHNPADGIFGPKTADAVRAWQRIAGLDPTGAVASYTWESLANAYRALEEGRYGSEGQFGGVLGPESV